MGEFDNFRLSFHSGKRNGLSKSRAAFAILTKEKNNDNFKSCLTPKI